MDGMQLGLCRHDFEDKVRAVFGMVLEEKQKIPYTHRSFSKRRSRDIHGNQGMSWDLLRVYIKLLLRRSHRA